MQKVHTSALYQVVCNCIKQIKAIVFKKRKERGSGTYKECDGTQPNVLLEMGKWAQNENMSNLENI